LIYLQKKKIFLQYTALCILLLLILASCGCGAKQASNGQAVNLVSVNTVQVKTGVLNISRTISGKLEAWKSVNLAPKIPGKVSSVNVDLGSFVKSGQTLITLDNTDLAAALDQAKAGVTAAESALSSANRSYLIAQDNYERGKELFAQGVIPKAVFDSEYALKYELAKEQVEKEMPARLEQAKAGLALAESSYNNSIITAPFTGFVADLSVKAGEMASNAAPAISLVNLDKVTVKTFVPESLINQLKTGQIVKVEVSAVSKQLFSGIITNMSPAADPAAGNFAVKIGIDNAKHILKPGMFASVKFSPTPVKNILVPVEAVVGASNTKFIWVVKNGYVSRKEVKIGQSDGTSVAVTQGLSEGDEIVIAGQENLQEGSKVTVVNSNK